MRTDQTKAYGATSSATVSDITVHETTADAIVTVAAGSRTERKPVTFPYNEKMTMEQVKTKALKAALEEVDEMAAVLRSEISDREARQL